MSEENLTLEQNFSNYIMIHKLTIIQVALTSFADKKIYEKDFFKKYKNLDMDNNEKARFIMEDLYNNKVENLDEIYEYCWKKVRYLIP